jgi:hypothetical protein
MNNYIATIVVGLVLSVIFLGISVWQLSIYTIVNNIIYVTHILPDNTSVELIKILLKLQDMIDLNELKEVKAYIRTYMGVWKACVSVASIILIVCVFLLLKETLTQKSTKKNKSKNKKK